MFNNLASDYAVLLVGDNPDERSGIVLAFMRAAPNVRICLAEDVSQAEAYLSGDAQYADREEYPIPQVILLDIDLARRSRFQILKWLRGKPQLNQIPVIVLASSHESSDVDRAYALGASSCLLKSANDGIMHEISKGIGDYAALLKLRFVRAFNGLSTDHGDENDHWVQSHAPGTTRAARAAERNPWRCSRLIRER